MKHASIVETNVLATANGHASHSNEGCVSRCIEELAKVINGGYLLIDDGGRIFKEYARYATRKGQPGPGDAFFKWAWYNQTNDSVCGLIAITEISGSENHFEEFPTDASLINFDRADRKWIAVSVASNRDPEILNATDTDWWNYIEALEQNGIRVRFICPEHMKTKVKKKHIGRQIRKRRD